MVASKSPSTICITSGKGGVGKTSLTVNLAYALSQSQNRVLIVDGDLGLANVDVLLGLPVEKTIRDILDNDQDPLESVVRVTSRIGLLPSSSGVPEMVTLGPDEQTRLGDLLNLIMGHFDYVLVDTAAGIGPSVLWFNSITDHNVVITGPDPASLTDAYALIKVLYKEYNRGVFHVIVNFVANEREARRIYETLSNVTVQFLGLRPKYMGGIPRDRAVIKAAREQRPFVEKSPHEVAARAVLQVADRIMALD